MSAKKKTETVTLVMKTKHQLELTKMTVELKLR